jgi:hypothetical protein
MSNMSNTLESDFLAWLFQDTAPSWAAVTNLYVSLHTSNPGEAGSQNTAESAYTSYSRVAVVRTSSGWAIVSGSMKNVAVVAFPACTGGSETITHVGVGTASSGAGVLLAYGALTSSIAVSTGITPTFAINAISFTAD